jgi:hypothetical protein
MEKEKENDIVISNPWYPDTKLAMYQCSCGGEMVSLEKWEDEEDVYLSLWSRGYMYPLTWREKFKYCWHILTKGKPYGDSIILTKEVAKKIGNKLIEYTE